MKKLLTVLMVLCLVASIAAPGYAAVGRKGASDMAMEKASDESVFNRVGDWWATKGKSPAEKQAILTKRKAQRAAKRAQKGAEKQTKELNKQVKKTSQGMKAKMGK